MSDRRFLRRRGALLGVALALLTGGAAATARTAGPSIVYRDHVVRIDGELSDWDASTRFADFTDPDGEPAARNRVRVWACWDLDALWLAVAVDDAELVEAPADARVDQYHAYDSLQVYLDPDGDDGDTMDEDDIDLILLPDGRHGVLRGDRLLLRLVDARVPQREGAPLLLDVAVRQRAGGWDTELRIPFAALGVPSGPGGRLRMDVANNDWRVPHPPSTAPEPFAPDQLRSGAVAPAAADPVVGRMLWPLTWSGRRDFGYPRDWRPVLLTGQPPRWESWWRRQSLASLLLWSALLVTGATVLATGLQWWLFRRRLRRLIGRMAVPPANAEPVAEASPAAAPSPAIEAAADPRDRAFAERVLDHVRGHLADDLSPARLAEHFHVSLRTLQRRLANGIGSSPQDLVLAARLEQAREMLASGVLRVGEVAAAVGFDDLSHFSRRYKSAFGHPPSQAPRRP